MDVSVIITTYKTKDLFKTALESVLADLQEASFSYEILVMDNASRDGTVEMMKESYPEIPYLENEKNEGLARALNKGITSTTGRYLLTIDSDVQLEKGTIPTLYRYLEENLQYSGATTDIKTPEGRRCKTRFRIGLNLVKPSFKAPFPVEFTGNTLCFIRREAYEDVGLYDPAYIYSVEDLDWSHRAKQKGHRFILLPDLCTLHHRRQGKFSNYAAVIEELYRTNLYYYKKFYPSPLITLFYWGMSVEIRFNSYKNRENKRMKEAFQKAKKKMKEEYQAIE